VFKIFNKSHSSLKLQKFRLPQGHPNLGIFQKHRLPVHLIEIICNLHFHPPAVTLTDALDENPLLLPEERVVVILQPILLFNQSLTQSYDNPRVEHLVRDLTQSVDVPPKTLHGEEVTLALVLPLEPVEAARTHTKRLGALVALMQRRACSADVQNGLVEGVERHVK